MYVTGDRELAKAGGGDMGNINPAGGGGGGDRGHKPTGCNPLINPDKKHLQHQNDLNCNKQSLPAPKFIDSGKNGNVQTDGRTCYSIISKTVDHEYITRPVSSERTISPVSMLGTDKIRLTMDVNNSRPTSKSTTPILTRKAAIRDYPSPSPNTSDQNRSGSNSSLKDSQAKDIMISYSHLDKDIMMRLKGM